MRVGIVGSGRIGGNAGKLLARAGHEVMFSFSRDPAKLEALASEAGHDASVGTPSEAARFGEAVMLSVPWAVVDEALEAAGPLGGKVLIDTTNQFTRGGLAELPGGLSAAEFNARRARGARPVKAYNTLTAGFQAEASRRPAPERVAMFFAGEDEEAKGIVAGLIRDSGFEPVDVGGWGEVWIMEAPRREGAVYGEEYRPDEARRIAAALREGDPDLAARLARELKV
jgi:8-hydroxy-5-deazaflavin:NADPH oxidoreductase